jgi:glyoxylase-like metal-dependent hydrolase (beta-lactamase superfamily II)
MIIEQHYLDCLAQASYLVVDESSGVAVVIDPRRDVDVYLGRAEALGARIEHVLLTHFHADFVSGHLELRERTGATIHMGARAEPEFELEPMADGGRLKLGRVTFEFLETPGHTPESVTILVYDLEKSAEEPEAAFTGDTLFIGDVGRPDLLGSVGLTPETLAGWMYDSLHGKILTLPDATLVYPGHGAGSACGKNLSSETVSTIGDQRRFNYALQPMEKEEFVRILTTDQPAAPAYFPHDVQMNRSEHATLDEVLAESLRPIEPVEALRRVWAGELVLIDTRDADAYAERCVEGSIHIGLDGMYASWVGTLVPSHASILILAAPGTEEDSVKRLARIGFDRVAGWIDGGIDAIPEPEPDAEGDPLYTIRQLKRLTKEELEARLASDDPPLVLDVRNPGEWEAGHIEGALHVPLGQLPRRLEEIPFERDVVCVCKSGYRSSTAVSLLVHWTTRELADLVGGMDAWAGAGACQA